MIWGVFAAPRSEHRLRGAALTAVQMLVLGAGVAALAASSHGVLAVIFAGLVVVNAVLIGVWHQN